MSLLVCCLFRRAARRCKRAFFSSSRCLRHHEAHTYMHLHARACACVSHTCVCVYVDACLCASGQMLQHAPWCRGLEECGVPRCSQMRNHFNVKRQEMPSENSLTTCSLFNLRMSELTVRIVQVQAANRTGQGIARWTPTTMCPLPPGITWPSLALLLRTKSHHSQAKR